ncbi:MAG: alpha-galactosidase [Clostridiales bacterium]|nr:alpha-galactosidase [Clostridiales bacterium]
MKNISFEVKYSIGKREYDIPLTENKHFRIDYELSDSSFKAKIISKACITLKSVDVHFAREFKPGDKFFANGYQSWTTSKEYTVSDSEKDITPIAVGEALHNFAGISSDCRFAKHTCEQGQFVSHCYTYIRNGEAVDFYGSLSERQGFTVFYADMVRSMMRVSKDVEGVSINGCEYELFDIVMLSGAYDEVFDRYFELMGVKKPRLSHMSGYTSWYNYFGKIDENIIERDLNSLDRLKESVSVFQVDDGYETAVGDWLKHNEKKFPKGMKYIADKIHEKGYMAGIWIAPFNAQTSSDLLRKHPDWFIKSKHGLPQIGVAAWGGAAVLDLYNENAREYIRHFFDVVLNDWGYDMVKLDFLYSQCLYPRNNKSRGTIMCEAMDFLRECCGDKLILGCGVPLGAAFKVVDACRISCDVDLKYSGKFYNVLHINSEVPSAKNAITNSVFRRHLDGRVFVNDPDVFFMRYSNLDFNMDQKHLLAGINHLFGNVLFVSDDAKEYNSKDAEVVRKAFAVCDKKVISADIDGDDGRIVLLDGETEKVFRFNMKTGQSNADEIFGFESLEGENK